MKQWHQPEFVSDQWQHHETFNAYVYRLILHDRMNTSAFQVLKKIYGLKYLVKIAKEWETRHESEKPYRKG